MCTTTPLANFVAVDGREVLDGVPLAEQLLSGTDRHGPHRQALLVHEVRGGERTGEGGEPHAITSRPASPLDRGVSVARSPRATPGRRPPGLGVVEGPGEHDVGCRRTRERSTC
jgi:hypothetical protein